MSNINYILSYNPHATSPQSQQTHIFISQNRDISTWYLPFPGTYLIKSPQPLSALNGQFLQHFGATPFVLSFAPSSYVTGSLPTSIWQWFNDVPNPFLPSN